MDSIPRINSSLLFFFFIYIYIFILEAQLNTYIVLDACHTNAKIEARGEMQNTNLKIECKNEKL